MQTQAEVRKLRGQGVCWVWKKVPMEGQWVTGLSEEKRETMIEPGPSGELSLALDLARFAIENTSLDYLHTP